MYWLNFGLVVMFTILTDICWGLYIMKVGEKKALPASIWGAIIPFLSANTILMYVDDHSFMWAAVIGAFIGTYITIKYLKK